MQIDRSFLVSALVYAIVGMGLGIFMASSQNHIQHVTHAHVLLVGFVASFIYAVIHKLWLSADATLLAKAQFFIHQAGALAMFIGLFLYYGAIVPHEQVDPLLGAASVAVLTGAVLMVWLVLRSKHA